MSNAVLKVFLEDIGPCKQFLSLFVTRSNKTDKSHVKRLESKIKLLILDVDFASYLFLTNNL
jgi:hypothetical protein